MIPPYSSMLVHAMNRGDNLGTRRSRVTGTRLNDIRELHASLTRNPSPAQQLQFCTREPFCSIGARAGGSVRPSSVLDYSDAAQQVCIATRDLRLSLW